MRILGVSPADLTGWRDPSSPSKWAPFFRAVGEHVEVVDVVRTPRLTRTRAEAALQRALGRKLALPDAYRAAAFGARSRALEPALASRDDEVDVVLQLQTLHAPGVNRRPYAICTDSTHALLERHRSRLHPGRPTDRRVLALEQRVAQEALVVLCWSDFVRRSFIEDYGVDPDRVVVSGAGANFVLDEVPDRSAQPPRALFVGYEFERKGGLTLLDAWAEVERRLPGAELVVAGPRAAVPSAARNVRWVGRASRADLVELYRDATAFVLPSLFEPFGLVLLEAMGNGLPVVASDCCAMPELVEEGVTGALAAPADAAALADALVRVLEDPVRAAAMGRTGHAAVLERHLWSHVGERMARPLLEARETVAALDAAPGRIAAGALQMPGLVG